MSRKAAGTRLLLYVLRRHVEECGSLVGLDERLEGREVEIEALLGF
jgi:hypothetical protein